MRAITILLTTALLLAAMPAIGANPPVFSTEAGAIRGYDPVAYFTLDQAVKGLEEISYQWKGAEWHFSTADNREKFQAEPEKYAPKFGGYCALGMSKGSYTPSEPEAFTIRNGVLYLNSSQLAQTAWLKNVEGFIDKALEKWAIFRKS